MNGIYAVITVFMIIGFAIFSFTMPSITMSVSKPIVDFYNNMIESNFTIVYLNTSGNMMKISIINNNTAFYPNEYVFNNLTFKANNSSTIITIPKANGTIFAVNGTERYPIANFVK